MERRTFLIGGISAVGLFVLSSCVPPEPIPTPEPGPTETDLQQPTAFARTNWSSDPFSLGAQSFLAAGATHAHRVALRQPVAERIFLAGEATADEHAGTVAGAWASGLRVAEEVASAAAIGERIAIIGAGIAGAAAARQLAAAGHDVVVLEGRDRAGGRIHSLTGDEWPIPVQAGAGVVRDVVESPILGELAALGIATGLLEGEPEVRTADGTVVTRPEIVTATVAAAIDAAQDDRSVVSLASALAEVGAGTLSNTPDETGVSEAEWLRHYLNTVVEDQTGANIRFLAATGGWELPQGPERLVAGDLQELVNNSLVDIDLRMSSAVSNVTYDGEVVGLRFVTGESLQAERVIVTVPLGVLKNDAITFEPPLPESHQEAIAALGMGTIEKVLLRFEQPFWQTDAPVWSVVDPSLLFRHWINLEPLTGEAVLVGIAAADEADAMAELGDDEVRAEALASLRAFGLNE